MCIAASSYHTVLAFQWRILLCCVFQALNAVTKLQCCEDSCLTLPWYLYEDLARKADMGSHRQCYLGTGLTAAAERYTTSYSDVGLNCCHMQFQGAASLPASMAPCW
jgi:hypothetical protein